MVDYVIDNREPTEKELDEIIALMNKVWHKIYYDDGIYYYTKDVLDLYTKNPYQRPEHYWIAFEKNTRKIIGFALVTPWKVKIYGKGPYNLAYGSLITTDLEYQQQGIGKSIAKEISKCYDKLNFLGAITNFEVISKGIKTISKERSDCIIKLRTSEYAYIRPLNVKGRERLMNMKFYEKIGARLIQGVKPVNDSRIRPVQERDLSQILSLLNEYSEKLNIARVWSEEELRMLLSNPLYRGKVIEINGEIKAILSAIIYPFEVKGVSVKIACLEDCNYEHVDMDLQKKLVRAMLYDLKQEDVAVLNDFNIGYRDLTPLRKNRFIKYPRELSSYIILSNKDKMDAVKEIKTNDETIYMEVR